MELVIIALIAVEVVIVCTPTVILILPVLCTPVSGSDTGWPRTLANGFWIISC